MNEHRVKIISYLDRSTATCSCGTLNSKSRFGDRRTAAAKRDIYIHLEKVFSSMDPDGSVEPDYQIKDGSALNCPVCKEDLELAKEDFGLLDESSPSVINCAQGHTFDAYFKKKTLFLFLEGADFHSPFSTT